MRRLLAIMGSSGSGKTTLLNSLANQLPVNKCLRLTGSITVNGHSHAVRLIKPHTEAK
jgi:ABC-type multidrug transport system ATPase subunit